MICSKQSAISSQQKGQSLLEVLTALGIAAIIVVGLITLAVYGLRNAQHGKNVETATRLAGQVIEEVRTVRDRQGWSLFSTYATGTCYQVRTSDWTLQPEGDATPCGGVAVPNFSGFTREISLTIDSTNCPGECRKVTVRVLWVDSRGTNEISNNTFLTQWQ